MDDMIQGVRLTPLKRIPGNQGEVRHVLKRSEDGYIDFGEAYVSTVIRGAIKGWKKHLRMTSNLTVLNGCVKFVCFDDRKDSPTAGVVNEFEISPDRHARLTIPPGVWFSFSGISEEENIVLNIADILHEPAEAESKDIRDALFPPVWDKNPAGF